MVGRSAAPSPGGAQEDIGVYVTFHLGYPTTIPASDSSASIPFVDGALHLVWKSTGGVAGAGSSGVHEAGPILATASRAEEASPDAEDLLAEAVAHLPPNERAAIVNAPGPRAGGPALHRMSRGVVTTVDEIRAGAVRPRAPGAHHPIAGPAGSATAKLARDSARMRALCAATHDKPFGLPETVCKPAAVRDHRGEVRDHR